MTPLQFQDLLCDCLSIFICYDRHALYASILVAHRQTHKHVLPDVAGVEDTFIFGVDAKNHDLSDCRLEFGNLSLEGDLRG